MNSKPPLLCLGGSLVRKSMERLSLPHHSTTPGFVARRVKPKDGCAALIGEFEFKRKRLSTVKEILKAWNPRLAEHDNPSGPRF